MQRIRIDHCKPCGKPPFNPANRLTETIHLSIPENGLPQSMVYRTSDRPEMNVDRAGLQSRTSSYWLGGVSSLSRIFIIPSRASFEIPVGINT
jgi:hypothetical protein